MSYVNKLIIKEYLDCDDRKCHNLISILKTKLPTTTISFMKEYMIRGKKTTGMMFTMSVDAEDALALSLKMLANTTNKRINKEAWEDIKNIALYSINKGLVQ